jgi:cyclase
MLSTRIILFAGILGLSGMAVSLPASAAQAPQMQLREIAKDVYVVEHPTGSSNAMFVVTPDGVVVWDGDIRTADQVLAAIRRTTDKKIRCYIISHPAGDHATGGWNYREDAPMMIASSTQAKSLAAEELEEFATRKVSNDPLYSVYHNAELVQPNITFEGSLTMKFGGLTFVVTEEGAQHSTSDLTLYIPEKRVLAMGDLFKSEIHTGPGDTAYKTFSAAKGWIGVIDKIMARNLPVDTYVPGHGPVHAGRGVEDLRELRTYFLTMRGEVGRLIQAGKTSDEVTKEFKTPVPFDKYGQAPGIVRFLPLYYRDLLAEGVKPR